MKVQIKCSCCGGVNGRLIYENLTSIYSDRPWSLAVCDGCKNIITLPVPSIKLLDEIYSTNYLYDVHLLVLNEKKFRSREIAGFIRKSFHSNQKPSLFEAGCMYGYLLEELQKDFNVSGIEISDDAVKYCKSRRLNVTDISIENYLLNNNESFDLIILSHVFEHLLSPEIIIDQLRDRLNPGGKIIICVPNSSSFFRKIFGKYWGWWQVPVHINHFCESALREMASRKGMKIETVRYRGGDSLMILLNLINLFGFRSKNSQPGFFQKSVIRTFSFFLRYWYYIGNEEVTVVMERD